MNEEYVRTDLDVAIRGKSSFYQKFYFAIKRVFDFIVGLIGSLVTLPIMVVVKIAYLCHGDFAPILFKQERIGMNGKPIYIYKFRTMVMNADDVLQELLRTNEEMAVEYKRYKKLKNDPRITKVGHFLRKSSLDEFPQFFNVLKGDMSLVGPRPYLYREKQDMGEYFDTIVQAKPGITGYWQVNGRSNTDFGKRLVLDEYYLYHRGIRLDIKIFCKTFAQVILKKDSM